MRHPLLVAAIAGIVVSGLVAAILELLRWAGVLQ
jgi:hypothetical protein